MELNRVFENTLQLRLSNPTPQSAAKSAEYRRIQSGSPKIYDGRHAQANPADTAAPPIQSNPAFAYFPSKALDPTYEVPRDSQELKTISATIHGNARESNNTPLLEKVIGRHFIRAFTRDCRGAHDVALSSHKHIPIYYMAIKTRNELRGGGSDPSVEAFFSPLHTSIPESGISPKEQLSCILGGPWLAILGAVLTEKMYRPTTYGVHLDASTRRRPIPPNRACPVYAQGISRPGQNLV
ncbi:hypothetical protein EDB19DRAFT_2043710 [Suillus lakei]|nr:hypothetical protein EDB19DRAFT_2043710 [Suillus lakei]